MKVNMKLTAVFEEAEEGGYIAYLEEIPGVNTQGETLDEAKANLEEAFKMIIIIQRSLQNKALGNRKVIKEIFELS